MRKTYGSIFAWAYRPVALACTVALTVHSLAWAEPSINSVQTGQVVQGGTYLNTTDGRTTFRNTFGSGLWVKNNSTVRGLEVDSSGNLTNNGGTLHFYAPNGMVRVDGTIDVNALRSGRGAYLGNGGKVFVDADYLYQSGNILANGINGGLVQVNVGSMTLTPGARMEAKGQGGEGGVVTVNTTDAVDIQHGAVIDTSGKVIGSFDRNLINIEGGLVNMEGLLRADGIGSRGGTIRLVASGQSSLGSVNDVLRMSATTGNKPIVNLGEANHLSTRSRQLFNRQDGNVHIGKTGVVNARGANGNVAVGNDFIADNAPRAGDGGTILLAAQYNVHNRGLVTVNGGNGQSGNKPVAGGQGGTLAVLTSGNICNTGQFQANGGNGGSFTQPVITDSRTVTGNNGFTVLVDDGNGEIHYESESIADASVNTGANGGQGGLIAFSYKGTMTNIGSISVNGGNGGNGGAALAIDASYAIPRQSARAFATAIGGGAGNGAKGGLIVFSGEDNPLGNGHLQASGGIAGKSGRATAKAGAVSLENEDHRHNQHAFARATAISGAQGIGGNTGTFVAPKPNTLKNTQQIIQNRTLRGEVGTATAQAVALATDDADADARAVGGLGSYSQSLAATVDYIGKPSNDLKGLPGLGVLGQALVKALNYKNSHIPGSLNPEHSVFFNRPRRALEALLLFGNRQGMIEAVESKSTLSGFDGRAILTDPDYAIAATELQVLIPSKPLSSPNIVQLRPFESLVHGENLIQLTSNTPIGQYARASNIRTVRIPAGNSPLLEAEIFSKAFGQDYPFRNFIGTDMDEIQLHGSASAPSVSSLNTLTMVNDGREFGSGFGWKLGSPKNFGGGRISWLATGDIVANSLITQGKASGGSIHLVSNNGISLFPEFSIVSTSALSSPLSLHGGSMLLKGQGGFSSYISSISTDGSLMGGVQRYRFGNDVSPFASELTTRGSQGGIITMDVGKSVFLSPGPFNSFISANGGFIRIKAGEEISSRPFAITAGEDGTVVLIAPVISDPIEPTE
jgi:hypothetical protein